MSAAPDPRAADVPAETQAGGPDTPPRAARPGRRSLAAALLLGVTGFALTLLAAGRVWAKGTVPLAQGRLTVAVEGQDVTSVPGAAALVGLTALVAVFAVRGFGRLLVSSLLLLAGVAVAVASLRALGDTAALDAEAARAAGLTDASAAAVVHTAWPWAAAAGGALLLVAGLLALFRGRHWPGMSSRYDAPGSAAAPGRRRAFAPAVDPDRPEDVWKALDRGEDPTDTV